jgi:hypothetical protein
MDCLRSFNFNLTTQANWGVANGFKHWQIGTQHFWLFQQQDATGAIYTIQGFKNINIFKIEIVGDWYSSASPVGVSALPQNWNFGFGIVGQNSPSVGSVTNPIFGMIETFNTPYFTLSKYQRSISFESPIQSAKEIKLFNVYCDGIADQSTASVQLGYNMTVTVFYQFEGENL